MSGSMARRLALAVLGVWAVGFAVDVGLTIVTWGVETPGTQTGFGAFDYVGFEAAFVAYPAVGAMIVLRYPTNRIGWLFLTVGVLLVAASAAPQYVYEGRYVDPGSLPGTAWAAWASGWLEPLFLLALALLLLVFPDGRPPSPSWRPALWIVWACIAVAIVDSALKPGVIREGDMPVENPIGIASAAGLFAALDNVVFLLFLASMVTGVAAIVRRFVVSRGEVRQQVEWLALAGLALVVALVGDVVSAVAGVGQQASNFSFGLVFAAIPVAAGLAILKYRLYDIDRLVSRTLVYGALTVVLAATYAGLVLGGQVVFSSVAGGSNLAIAASTLVVAGLFLPLRARVQRFVDRRFYRRRYDAQRTLEAFGARLREQVELEVLTRELGDVVRETMQPAATGVWLRARP